jgi:VWFA-related protein
MFRFRALLALVLFTSLLAAQVKDGASVAFLATATDGRGRIAGDLRQGDFELREDDKVQQISSFSTFRDSPSNVGILLDVSGSMRPKLAAASNAIEDFVLGLYRYDEVFLMPFAERSAVVSDYNDGRQELIGKLRRLRAEGDTALYDALNDGLRELGRGRHRRKVLVLLSDGADAVSGLSYGQLVRTLRESDVIVYAIGIPAGISSMFYTPSSNFAGQIVIQGPRGQSPVPFPIPGAGGIPIPIPGRPIPLPAPRNPDDTGDTVNMSVLDALAQMTGGRAWRAEDPQRRIGEPLDRIVAQILAELRSQYLIGFVPQHPLKDGRWHDVVIRTKESGTSVRSRKEYLGK